jgi:hypothetical protein
MNGTRTSDHGLVIEEVDERALPRRTLVMSELLRRFEFLLDLLDGFAGHDHLGHRVAHHDEIAPLFFEIGDTAPDMHGAVPWNIGIDR